MDQLYLNYLMKVLIILFDCIQLLPILEFSNIQLSNILLFLPILTFPINLLFDPIFKSLKKVNFEFLSKYKLSFLK